MKSLIIFFVCVSVACLFLDTKADCEARDGSKKMYSTGSSVQIECALHTCGDDGGWSSSGCALWKCASLEKGYKEQNNTLPYPECCPGPICDDP